jgi:hypothetical protein
MRRLLDDHGFRVLRDEGLPAVGARVSPSVARATRVMKHMRVAVAERLERA